MNLKKNGAGIFLTQGSLRNYYVYIYNEFFKETISFKAIIVIRCAGVIILEERKIIKMRCYFFHKFYDPKKLPKKSESTNSRNTRILSEQ